MRKTSGLSLLLLMFLSLCLITFSLLSVSEAAADQKLSSRSAARTTEYYAACTAANELLSEIDAQLAQNLGAAESADDPETQYLALCEAVPETLPDVSCSRTGDSLELSFSVSVTDTQLLEVTLTAVYPRQEEDPLCEVAKWTITNTRDWNPDTSMNLYHTEKNHKGASNGT